MNEKSWFCKQLSVCVCVREALITLHESFMLCEILNRTESKVPGILSNTQNMRLPRNSCHFKAPRGTNLQQHKNRKAAAKTEISKPKKTVSAEATYYNSRASHSREKVLGMRTCQWHPQTIRNCEDGTRRSGLPNIDQETEKRNMCVCVWDCVTCRQQQQPEQHPSSVRRRSC